MPKISVIIPTYNCAKYLSQAIESVLSQTYIDFEIVIVDDGSADDTKSLVERYMQKFPEKISYIYQDNKGLACARNVAIRNSRGLYIALLDADDIFLPDRLQLGVEALDQNPEVGLCHANITRIDEDGKFIRTPVRDERFLSGSIFDYIFLRRANVSVPTILFRRSCIEVVGEFDESLTRLGCEDREFCLRVAKSYKFFYINKVLAYYRERSNSMSQDLEKMTKARYYVINKHSMTKSGTYFLKRRAFASVHKELGDASLKKRFLGEAADHYLKSIGYWPFNFWSCVNLLKAILCLCLGKNAKINHVEFL